MSTLMKRLAIGTCLLLILVMLLPMFLFVIDEREMGVVMRFGNPTRHHIEPGMYFKIPVVETVRRLPRTRQFWGDDPLLLLPDLPTRDDKKIELIPWAVWRIKEPTVFVKRLRTEENAEERVAQMCRSAIRDVITQYDLAELVRSTSRELPTVSDNFEEFATPTLPGTDASEAEALLKKTDANQPIREIELGRPKILEKIKQEAQRRLAAKVGEGSEGRGIELVDVGISQIAFVDSVRKMTFDRWVAEREAISARNINEGERLKAAIINETKAEVERIEGEGQRTAHETRGKADAEIIRDYADAINKTGEFYNFVRTLEAYKSSIGTDSRMILTTDSDFFRLLKELPEVEVEPSTSKDETEEVPRT